MDIKEIIKKDIPYFTGLCVVRIAESTIPIHIIQILNIIKIDIFNKSEITHCKKILIVGNGADRGKYFITDIKEIISTEDYKRNISKQSSHFSYLNLESTSQGLVIVFKKTTEIKEFSTKNISFESSFYIIKSDSFHLKSLHLKGFKELGREINFSFCDGSITIIHGENGSGKTTFLKIIQAILRKDIAFLRKENVQSFELIFQRGKEDVMLFFDINDIENNEKKYEMAYQTLQNLHSTFFGINRGVIETTQTYIEHIYSQLLRVTKLDAPPRGKAAEILGQLLKEIPDKMSLSEEEKNIETNHKVIDNLSIELIEKTLRKAFDKGKNAIIKGMNNAFLNAMDSFLTSVGDEDIYIPEDFEVRFKAKKSFFQSFIKDLENSKSKEKLKAFVDSDNFQSIHKENDLFKSLIINMLKQAESDEKNDIELKAIYRVIDTFNDFLVRSKKMVLDAVEANIVFPNGSKHKLSELSSGERHLLCFLTVFLIMERNSNIFLIDEPEVSLSMSWQRKLLPLLSEFAPQAQIIVATHSPEIVNEHDEYLRELN